MEKCYARAGNNSAYDKAFKSINLEMSVQNTRKTSWQIGSIVCSEKSCSVYITGDTEWNADGLSSS